MRIELTYITPLLAAGAAAVAIAAAAPAAAAAKWADLLGKYLQSPGNVQINDARPPVQFYPYGDITFLLGGLDGLGGHGGLRGGLMG
jgi:hypothetical protein